MAQPLGLDVFFNQDAQGLTDRPRRSGSSVGAPLDEALVGTIASAEGLNPTQQRVMTALLQQESGYGRNTSTSVNGAQGAGQIIPDTFRRYAKPGERIDNPEHNLAVMARIVKDLGGKTGDDPARIATGYFSGEGNIAREGTQAWKNDAADGNGKRVSGYVTDVVGRYGQTPEAKPAQPAQAAGPDLSKAPAWATIKAKPEFLSLSKEDKAAAKQAYFDYWIAPNGGDDALRQKFMATEDADGLNAGLAVEQFKSGVAGLQSGYYSNAARNNAALLNAMDKMDRGERVPIDQDPVGYSEMNPEQRKAIREQVTGSFAGSAARAVKYTGEQKQYKSNPAAKAAVELADKGNYRGAWNAFKSDPAGVIQQLSVESAPNAIPAAIAAATGVALGGGVAGFMTGLAGGSFPVEFSASVAESLQESGVNMEDYGAVEAKLRDPAFIKAAGQRAVTRGSVIATADMAGGGLALPLKAGLRQIPKNVLRVGATGGAEISTEMAGEAAAQAASGEEFKVGQILAEGLGAGPQTVGMSLARTVAEAAKKPDTITPDGRIETAPPAPLDAQAPPVSPMQQSADAIVEELAQQTGIPRETVLPTAPAEPEALAAPAAPTEPTAQTAPQGQPPAADSFTDEDVLGFAQTRLDALTIKRDGERVTTMGENGPVDQTIPGVGLSPAEQDEIGALEQAMASGEPQVIRDLYGLNDQPPEAAAAPAVEAAPELNVPADAPNVPAVESEAAIEARLEREAIQNEAPAAQDQQDDIEIPGFAPPRTEKEARERRANNQQEPNATQREQVAGQATPAQGPQDGAGTAAPAAGAQDVRQPGAANERLIDSLPLEDNTEIQVIEQPGGITVRVFDKDAGQPAPAVRVFPKDREQDAFAYAVDLAAKSTPKPPAVPAGRPGYDTEVEVNAKALQNAFERDNGEALVNKPEKLEAWRNGTARTNPATSPVEVGFRDSGKFGVNDGRHRIALAAERGENVKVMVDGKDAERLKALASQPAGTQGTTAGTTAAGGSGVAPAGGRTIYRGYGRDRKESAYNGGSTPILGDAKYYAFDRDTASKYGPQVEESTLSLKNPLVIDSDEKWRSLTREAGWQFANPQGKTDAEAKEMTARLQQIVRDRGHDGVVIDFPADDARDILPDGRGIKTLRNVFGDPQSIVFDQPIEAKKPKTEQGKEPPAASAAVTPPKTEREARDSAAKESLSRTLNDPRVPVLDANGFEPPKWTELPNGFGFREYAVQTDKGKEAVQEVRAPVAGSKEPPVLRRILNPAGNFYEEREGTGTVDDIMSGVAFKDFDQYFNRLAPLAAPKTEKEAKANRAEGKWFGTEAKAQEFIVKQGLADTLQVVPNNNRFEIRKKEASSATPTGEVATQDVRYEGNQPTGDEGVRQGAGGSPGGAVVADPGALAPSGGTDQFVRGTQPQPDGALGQPTGAQRLDQRIRSDVERKKQEASAPQRGTIGMKLAGGEIVLTNTGRPTTPFPKVNTETARKAGNTVKAVDRWLILNALDEAQVRGDRFNERQFQSVNLLNATQSDKDAAEEYLFGDTIPKVVPSILKPLTNPSDSKAVNDYLEGRRPDVPTLEEVRSEQTPKTGTILFNQNGEDYRVEGIEGGKVKLTKNRDKLSEKTVLMDQGTLDRLVKEDAEYRAEPDGAQASKNTVFTEDAAAKAREILKRKLSGSQLNSGIDPEVMQAGITLAGYHIEKGARSFAAYAKAMIADLGDAVRPYLKSWYMGVKYDPRAAGFDGMDSAAVVEAADAMQDPKEAAPPKTEREAREKRQPSSAPSVKKPATPPQKDSPNLSGRKVTFDVLVEDTGQTAQVTVDAAREDEDLTARESAMRELIDCLRK